MQSIMPTWNRDLAAAMFGEPASLSIRALTSPPSLWQSAAADGVTVAGAAGGALAGATTGAAKAALHKVMLKTTLDAMLFHVRIKLFSSTFGPRESTARAWRHIDPRQTCSRRFSADDQFQNLI